MGSLCSSNSHQKSTCRYESFTSDTSTEDSDYLAYLTNLVLPSQEDLVRSFKKLTFENLDIKNFEYYEMSIASLLLSNRNTTTKVEVLREIMKPFPFLSKEEVTKFIAYFFEVSVNFCSLTPQQDQESSGQRGSTSYHSFLITKKEDFVNNHVCWIMHQKDSISTDDFLWNVRIMDWLLTPKKLRETVLNEYISVN